MTLYLIAVCLLAALLWVGLIYTIFQPSIARHKERHRYDAERARRREALR